MKISIGFPPGPRTRQLALLAEQLGYDRVWLYDSAARTKTSGPTWR